MTSDILIVPGYHGSGEAHWQTWLERELPSARRVSGIDWGQPVLHNWARSIMHDLDSIARPTIIVAHSFGCLATALAVSQRPLQVAGVILVAPADPDRFTLLGARRHQLVRNPGIAAQLPDRSLNTLGLVIGSRNDPWMKLQHAYAWACRWKLAFHDAGFAGHINVDAGYGPWPFIKMITQSMDEIIQERITGAQRSDTNVNHDAYPRAALGFSTKQILYA